MKKKILAILLTLSLISGMALPGTMAVEAETGSDVLSVETGSNASLDETAYTGTLICELEEHSHSEGECYTRSEEPTCGLTQTHVHDDSCYEMQEQEDEETGEVTQVQVLICKEEEIIPHVHGDGCYAAGELTCAVALSEGHTHGEGCYLTTTDLTCGLSEDENHTHGDECYTTTSSIVCTEAESAGHTHEAACYSASTLTCDRGEIPEHTHSTDCYEMALTCEKTEHQHTAECYEQTAGSVSGAQCNCDAVEGEAHAEDCPLYVAPECTCGAAEGEAHAEDCPMYVAPECTCGAEGLFHTSDCPLYEEPVTAAVYAEKDGVYTLLDTHGSASPLDVTEYNGQTLYVLADDLPQNLYFMREALGGLVGANFELSKNDCAVLTTGEGVIADTHAVVTLAGGILAGTELTLTANKLISGSYVVNIVVLEKLPADPTQLEISEVSADRKDAVEAVLADVIPALPENTTRSTYCFNIDPPANFVEGTEVEVVVPLGLSVAENVDVAVAVYHMNDDGSLKEVLEGALNEDGDIVFTTSSFSEFYFTVDFTYGDQTVSFEVGGKISLSLLMTMLGIDKGIHEVSSASIAGDAAAYVSVEELQIHEVYDEETGTLIANAYRDWELISNGEPFTVEGVLTIAFEDGSKVEILVTDALNASGEQSETTVSTETVWNLTGDVTLKGTVTIGQNTKLTITFDADRKIIWDGNSTNSTNAFSLQEESSLEIKGDEGKKLTLYGGNNFNLLSASANSDATATKAGCAICLVGSSTVDLEYVEFTGWYSNTKDCVFTMANSVVFDSNIRWKNVSVHDNISRCETNNIVHDGCVVRFLGKVTLENCTFVDNVADAKYGGVIKAPGGTGYCELNMTNCEASGNYSSGWGGALLWAASETYGESSSKATLKNCKFENNKAEWLGGAISTEAELELVDCLITENSAASGGGVAVFPFTRDDEDVNFKATAGLKLTGNNTISNNSATATAETITPKIRGLTENGDNNGKNKWITYPAGGGGIWCYLNKEVNNEQANKWSCELVTGQGTSITNNSSAYNGGGVMVAWGNGKAMKLKVEGAKISGNVADNNGGGVYCNAATMDFSTGTISQNEAACGGGICVTNGGSLNVTGGGFITENKAVGTSDINVTTAYQTSPVGTGGGIAVLGASGKTTSFTLSGDEVGIYKNLADFAADDVFANAVGTSLDVPAVDQMNLSGMGNTQPDGWFEDYHTNDTQYDQGTKMITDTATDDIIRYRDGAALDTPNIHKITNQSYNTASTYVCMTLGVSFGSLTISKSGYNETLDPNQSFIFHVEGTDDQTNHIKLTVVLSAANSWTTTIQTLPLGSYQVTEQNGWSWRYDPKENTGTQTEELTADVLAGYVSFENERKQNLWLDGNSWCVNLFKDGEAAKKSPDED